MNFNYTLLVIVLDIEESKFELLISFFSLNFEFEFSEAFDFDMRWHSTCAISSHDNAGTNFETNK